VAEVRALFWLWLVRFTLIDAPDFGDPPCLTTPGDCEDFCKALNDYTYADCAVLKGDTDRGIGCARFEEIKKSGKIDWAVGEQLAYGTLLMDGYSVRLSGQDARRF
jgi:hypothetical protein